MSEPVKAIKIHIQKPAQASDKFKEIPIGQKPKDETNFIQNNQCGKTEAIQGSGVPHIRQGSKESSK